MTPTASPPPRNLRDHVLRQSLRHPANLQAFLEQAVPTLAAGFDCSQARLLERDFPLDDWRHREADLPFEIPYRCGTEAILALVCVLIEHQSDTDPLMPLRLLYFAVLYWERQWKEWERLPRPKPSLRLRPVLPVVLYTGESPWGSNRTLIDLLGEPVAFHTFAPAWQPLFWNLEDQTPEGLLNSGRAWLQALAVLRAQGQDTAGFEQVFTQALHNLNALHDQDHVNWYDLLRIVLTYATWRRPLAERDRWVAAAVASQADVVSQQEVQTMGQTIADALIEQGFDKGRLLTSKSILRQLLEERFGTVPESLLQQIEQATDPARLQAATLQVRHLQTPDELRL
jgi:hypothetical protein